ncbi:hypothetical protein JZO70_20495 [Enterococcus sp. 669A]|uniref:Uncharacterized protein n=1 Tax=Candidatus Enterococcus moelleringii TaxID=2815325 RepID=A0ABS3LIM5_9ENTE|nr:hypothetical protein [Enterococcus sp. 669A]MBO1308566.1 hypothetical protein [Enterococcus sp. 669A]
MFGFGKQKKDTYQEPHQEDYFYDEYNNEGYEEEYGYDTYSEDGYERPAETYNEYERERAERPPRRRTSPTEERYDSRYDDEGESFSASVEEETVKESPLQQDIKRLEETVSQLKHQLEVKQTEMTNMATMLIENEQKHIDQKEKDQQIAELNQQVAQLKAQMQQEKQEKTDALVDAQQQIAELKKAQTENEEIKAELATILVETKKQEREILERAEFEARGIRSQAEQEAEQVLHDSALELRVMKQEIKNYRKRLRAAQEETTQFYVRLLANSDSLLEEE